MPIRNEKCMKPPHHTTWDDARPSLQEIGSWPLALIRLHQRLTSYFARPEPRHHALLYLQAIVSEIPRKKSWQIAEHAKQARPYGMQRLLSRAIWDEEGVRDEVRTFILHCLSPEVSQAPFRCSSWMKAAFPNGAATLPESRSSIAARLGKWTTVKWASSCPLSPLPDTPSSIANCTCQKTGAPTRLAGRRFISPRASVFRPNPSWPSAWFNGHSPPRCRSAGWWPIG